MSEILDLMERRASSRKFTGEPVPDEIIEKIVRAGTYAPTGKNKQSPIIIVVNNEEITDKLAQANKEIAGLSNNPFYGAKQVLVVLSKADVTTHVYDGALVMGQMMLAAEELGVASCWIHRAKQTFERPEWKEFLKSLGIEEEYEGIGNLIIGYDDNGKRPKSPRKENYVYWVR